MGSALLLEPLAASAEQAKRPSRATSLKPLTVPKGRPIRVAFLIAEPFQVIDFAGPWEIFSQVWDPKTEKEAFELYTVSKSKVPIKASGGLKVVPDYDFSDVPMPDVVVVPAQPDGIQESLDWLRKVTEHTQVTMSVCAGAFLLAKAGLLDGHRATTFHGSYKTMAIEHPKVKLQKQVRFVDEGHIATSSGLSAGIDLALHIVARYFGYPMADSIAAEIEYVGYGWKYPNDTGDIFKRLAAERKGPICPICDMGPVGKEISYKYKGATYYFCSEGCKRKFLDSPDKYLAGY